jgi:thioredoxin reductase
VLLDAICTGGQAAAAPGSRTTSARSASAPISRPGRAQALKFGPSGQPVPGGEIDTDRNGDLLRLHLQGGEVTSKAVVIATGAATGHSAGTLA